MKIHIIGICGRVCAPLAKSLAEEGHEITGSDDRPMPPVSLYLEKHKIACAPQFDASQVPADCDLVLVNSYYGAGDRR